MNKIKIKKKRIMFLATVPKQLQKESTPLPSPPPLPHLSWVQLHRCRSYTTFDE
jgi:hypothetical protein